MNISSTSNEFDSESNSELIKIAKRFFFPTILATLLENKLIDESKLSDHEYVWSKIKEHSEMLVNIPMIEWFEEDFLDTVREAIAAKRYEVAIVLVATVIEHHLNVFYRQALDANKLLITDEVTEIIRRANFRDKTGWLLLLVAKHQMSSELQEQIQQLTELRNQIVHFKAVPDSGAHDNTGGSHNLIKNRIRELNFDQVLTIPEQLSNFLDEALKSVREESPIYRRAEEIVRSLQL